MTGDFENYSMDWIGCSYRESGNLLSKNLFCLIAYLKSDLTHMDIHGFDNVVKQAS